MGGTLQKALVESAIAAAPVAALYFSGWAYLSSYAGLFGIDATQLDMPLSTVLVYSFSVLGSSRLVGATVFVVITVSLCRLAKISIGREYLPAILFAGLLISAFGIKAAADAKAFSLAQSVWLGNRSFSVPEIDATLADARIVADYSRCRDRRAFRQIIAFPERMYVLCRDRYIECHYGTMFVVSSDRRIIYTSFLSNPTINEDEQCADS
jgi:hypothetical protein